jgi:hypothetical protein
LGVEHAGLVVLVLVNVTQVALFDLEAHSAHRFVQAGYHRGVGDAKLALYVLDLAFAFHKGLNELDLLGGERLQPTQPESSVNARTTMAALQAGNGEDAGANRAFSGEWVHIYYLQLNFINLCLNFL